MDDTTVERLTAQRIVCNQRVPHVSFGGCTVDSNALTTLFSINKVLSMVHRKQNLASEYMSTFTRHNTCFRVGLLRNLRHKFDLAVTNMLAITILLAGFAVLGSAQDSSITSIFLPIVDAQTLVASLSHEVCSRLLEEPKLILAGR